MNLFWLLTPLLLIDVSLTKLQFIKGGEGVAKGGGLIYTLASGPKIVSFFVKKIPSCLKWSISTVCSIMHTTCIQFLARNIQCVRY